MRIATWNVNALGARLPFVLHWLESRRPDLVGLQELKLTDDRFPHEAFREAGYHGVSHGQKAWNGVAILSRQPAEPLMRGLEGHADAGARLVGARSAGLAFVTVYVPNGKTLEHPDYALKLAWLDGLRAELEGHDPQSPLVLCGDFNLCPAPLDSWNEELLAGRVHHSAAERDRFAALLDWGLIDLFRNRHPESAAFSWWDYRGGAFHRNRGLRIDFLLGTAPVAKRVKAIEIDRDYRKKKDGMTPSDHAPVIADLDWGAT